MNELKIVKGEYYAEYLEHANCYRLYKPDNPQRTVAYLDTLEDDKEEHNIKIVIIE